MESIPSLKPLVACLASLVVVVPIILSRRRPNLREGWTFLAGFVMAGTVISMIPPVLRDKVLEFTIWEIVPGLPLQFRADALGVFFALIASLLWIVTSLYSIGYMRGLREHAQTRFFAFFAIALSATLGVAFAGNLLTLYLFYEILSLSTYPLVTHHQDDEARIGGRTYLVYLLGTSIAFALPAMIFAYYKSGGTLDFSQGGFLAGKVSSVEASVLLLFFVFGFAKCGLMPFHSWLPSAMVAPTPVSALLHAVAVVKVGVFCIVRLLTGVFGFEFLREVSATEVILWLAAATVVISSLIALTQDNLKRRLAFSTIGQLSYVILGVALLTPSGLVGGVLHIGMHAMGKITLFFCAGAILVATGKKNVSEMKGLGWRMPLTFTAFLLGSLSVIGVPPLGGAWSKWYLLLGAFEAERPGIVVVLIVSSLLNVAYLLPIAGNAFFRRPDEEVEDRGMQEAPGACLIPLSLTAVGTFVLFIYPDLLLRLASL